MPCTQWGQTNWNIGLWSTERPIARAMHRECSEDLNSPVVFREELLFGWFWLLPAAFRISVPPPGMGARPQQWKHWVLTTGPPRNAQGRVFKDNIWSESCRVSLPLTSWCWGNKAAFREPQSSVFWFLAVWDLSARLPCCVYTPWDRTRTLFYHWTLVSWVLFGCSCIS